MKLKLSAFYIALISFLFSVLALAQVSAVSNSEWPVDIVSERGKITIYQPQPEALQSNVLSGRAAVSVAPMNKDAQFFGAIWFEAQLVTDLDKRTFDLQNIKVTKVKFSQPDAEKSFAALITSEIPKHNLHGSLDSLLATLADAKQEEQNETRLQTVPPKIIFTKYPAVLVPIEGEPKLQAITGSKLMRMVNTPMLIVFYPANKKYYLSSGSVWYSTTDVFGAWQVDRNLPVEVANMVTDDAGQPVKSVVADAAMPRIIVVTEPSELITSDGEPQYSPIKDTNLVFMSNSENNVFMDTATQSYYVLISGRWYTGKSLQRQEQWSFVAPDKLPTDFAKIPPNSAKGNVLSGVPNTKEAQDAMLEAQIPQTMAIKRNDAKLTVQYDGVPKFVVIKKTKIRYAINTATPVLLINGKYYACSNAIWFVAEMPNGPWVVADAIPSSIQTLPPDCPVYNVKYVYVYNSTPDVVYVGYTSGYYGWYPYYGTMVYGTGFSYPAWYGSYYYPWPYTFGFGVSYNSSWGWMLGAGWGGSFLATGWGWHNGWGTRGGWFNPTLGHFYRPNIMIHRDAFIGSRISVGGHRFPIEHRVWHSNMYRSNYQRFGRNVAGFTMAPTALSRGNIARANGDMLVDRSGRVYRNNKGVLEMHSGHQGWSRVSSPASISSPTRSLVTHAATHDKRQHQGVIDGRSQFKSKESTVSKVRPTSHSVSRSAAHSTVTNSISRSVPRSTSHSVAHISRTPHPVTTVPHSTARLPSTHVQHDYRAPQAAGAAMRTGGSSHGVGASGGHGAGGSHGVVGGGGHGGGSEMIHHGGRK